MIDGTLERGAVKNLLSSLQMLIFHFFLYSMRGDAYFMIPSGLITPHFSNILIVLFCIFWFLSQRIDEDKLFNLFSIYGNIVRIKLLHNKPDHALVQMGDGFQAELAVHFLKVWLFFFCSHFFTSGFPMSLWLQLSCLFCGI